jgi:hypothetical protein
MDNFDDDEEDLLIQKCCKKVDFLQDTIAKFNEQVSQLCSNAASLQDIHAFLLVSIIQFIIETSGKTSKMILILNLDK